MAGGWRYDHEQHEYKQPSADHDYKHDYDHGSTDDNCHTDHDHDYDPSGGP